MSGNNTILYVSGFSVNLRARDLAYEFERYGRLIRCDIPALKGPNSAPFAFIEFRRPGDAEDAYYDMHGRAIDGRRLMVQWAKRPPSVGWRHESGGRREPPRDFRNSRDDRDNRDGGDRGDRGGDRDNDRRDRERSPDDRRRSASPAARKAEDKDDEMRGGSRSPRSPRSPPREDSRDSRSPTKRENGDADHGRDVDDDERERRDE